MGSFNFSYQENDQQTITLEHVKADMLMKTKNSDYTRVNIPDKNSVTGVSFLILPSVCVHQNNDNSIAIDLGRDGYQLNVHVPKGRSGIMCEKRPVREIKDWYDSVMDEQITNQSQKDVYLDYFPQAWLHKGKVPGTTKVSIPDDRSKSGYGSIYVKDEMIRQAVHKGETTPAKGLYSVKLGKADMSLSYGYITDQGFVRTLDSVQSIVSRFEEHQKQSYENWKQSKSDKESIVANTQVESTNNDSLSKNTELEDPVISKEVLQNREVRLAQILPEAVYESDIEDELLAE